MASSAAVGFYVQEFNNNDSITYGLSRDIAGIYEKPLHLMLDAIFYYPHPVSDSNSPPPQQETSGYGSTFWSNGVQEHVLSNSQALDGDEERQQQPNNGGSSNWLSEYGSSICGGWGEDFQFCGWGTVDNGYGGGLEKADGSYHGGEEYDSSYYYYYKEKERQPGYDDDDDYSPWSGYGSWFGYGADEDFYESTSKPEPKLTHESSDEFGKFYQGIFGYWPCLLQKNYGEQEAYEYRNPLKGTAYYRFENSFRW